MQAIVSATPCAGECATTPLVVSTPGAPGENGEPGAQGEPGVNAYTFVATSVPPPQPVMPGAGGSVDVVVDDTSWMGVGQILYVETWGYLEVSVIINFNTVTLINLFDGADEYADNAAPGTSIAASSKVSPGGVQGPIGSTEGGALLAVNNLNDVPNDSLARGNLGLGSMSVQNANAVVIAGGSITGITDLAIADGGTGASSVGNAQINLGLVPGLDILGYTSLGDLIVNVAPGGGDFLYFPTNATISTPTFTAFALTLVDDADAATMRATLGITSGSMDMLLYQHRETVGTDGGAFTSGDWRTVPLNTEVVDVGNHGSIASNDITLAAGTYQFLFGVVGYIVNSFKGRLWNVSDGAVVPNVGGVTETYGSSVIAQATGANVGAISVGQGRFTLAISKVIRLQAACTTSNGTSGFGLGGGGGPEVFSFLQLYRES